MRRLLACGLALALAALAVATLAGTPEAQTAGRVLEACEPRKQEIDARTLPRTLEPDECPTGGRSISDGPVASVVPPPGRTVYAEVLTTSGAQELSVRRLPDGTIELDHVGEETPGDEPEAPVADASSRAANREGCYSSARTDLDQKVTGPITYNFNVSTTPGGISRSGASGAIKRAAGNVSNTKNTCSMGDRVPVALRYGGKTNASTQVANGHCGRNDGRSVVDFGYLKSGILAATCAIADDRPYYDEVLSADIRINSRGPRWTLEPNARSCSRAYDVEGVMTHEWGHFFGLGHVPEDGSRNLTMSRYINGPCQSSERTLGRGDVLGLDGKYAG